MTTPTGRWFVWAADEGPSPACGPHRSVEAAQKALARFRLRQGSRVNERLDATACCCMGYATQQNARAGVGLASVTTWRAVADMQVQTVRIVGTGRSRRVVRR